MFKIFQLKLIFYFILYFGVFNVGFAHDRIADSIIITSENKTSSQNALLTKQRIVDTFNKGIEVGATHMLIIWDTWDFEDSYNFSQYYYPGESVTDLIKHYDAPGFYRVSAVFAMHLDINEQLNNKRWYPEYPEYP